MNDPQPDNTNLPGSGDSDRDDSELIRIFSVVLRADSSRDEIGDALRPLCAKAKNDGVDVAEVLKLVKRSFAQSTLAKGMPHAAERQRALDQIISACIDEYYGAG